MIFNTLISLFIFLCSTAYVSGSPFGVTQLMMFRVGIPIIWIVGLCIPSKRKSNNIWLNGLLGYAWIQTVLLKGQPQGIALDIVVNVFLAVMLYYTLSEKLENIKPILNGICWVVGFQGIIILLQALGIDPICLNEAGVKNTNLVGLFGLKYLLGSWMALATPILLLNKRRVFGVISAILCLCSMSWASVGILAISLLVYCWVKSRKMFIVVVVLTTLTLGIYFGLINKPLYYRDQYINSSGVYIDNLNMHPMSILYKVKSRIDLQTKLLPMLFAKPITGYGLGSFKYLGPQINAYPYGTMTDAWNEYLEKGIELGIPFIVIFLWLCWDTLKKFTKSNIGVMCSLLTIPLGMLFHDLLNHASMGALMISVFSCLNVGDV